MRFLAILALTLLIANPAAAAEAHPADAFFATTSATFKVIGEATTLAADRLIAVMKSSPNFPGAISDLFARLADAGFDAWSLTGWAALFLSLGSVAELVFRRVVAQLAVPGPRADRASLAQRLVRFGADMLGLGIFALAGGWPLLMVVKNAPAVQTVAMTYLMAILIVRGFAVLLRMVLAPFQPKFRLAPLEDAEALRLYRHILGLTGFAAVSYVTASLLHSGGTGGDAILFFILTTRSLLAAAVVAACFANQAAVARIIGLSPDRQHRGRGWQSIARVWHLLAAIYVTFSWFVASMLLLLGNWQANGLALVSFFVVLGTAAACMVIDDRAARIDARMRDPAQPDLPSYAQFLARIGRAAAIVAGLALLLRIWGVAWLDLAQQNLSPSMLQILSQLLVTLAIAYALWNLVMIGTERTLRRLTGSGDDGASARATRTATLLPLFRNALLSTIMVIAVMIGMSSIGVDVVPLFAGAGVVGLAIGLGCQTLVKDVVSGLFFLLDDAFRLDEYVDVGEAKGTIERVSVRSLQLRHHLGPLHTVPFGEIKTIANMSRDWVVMRMEFRLPFDVDTVKLRKKFKELGQQLAEDPEIGHQFTVPLKSQGVVAMDESAQIVRAKFTCRPGDQFGLRRQVYDAVRQMFHREGIDVAVREVRVRAEPSQRNLPKPESAGPVSGISESEIAAAAFKPEP